MFPSLFKILEVSHLGQIRKRILVVKIFEKLTSFFAKYGQFSDGNVALFSRCSDVILKGTESLYIKFQHSQGKESKSPQLWNPFLYP